MNNRHPLLLEEFGRIAALDLPWQKLKDKTIAVTGATGLIGSYFLRALDEISRIHGLNLRFTALCRDPGSAAEKLQGIENLRFVQYDARRLTQTPFSADYILHAASNAHPAAFVSDPVGTMQANLLGTMHLLERVKETGGRLLFCSSGEIYGENPQAECFHEQSSGFIDPMRFRSCYPESKRAAETLCASYVHQYGVDALAVRLTYTYGPTITGQSTRADAQFLRKALAGEDITMTSPGSQVRSYCYAADAASALITLLFRGKAGEAYNVANPESNVSIRCYAQTLANLAGVKLAFDLPPEAERQGYSAVTRAVLDAGKLMQLGWKPEYDLAAGLHRTLEICK